MEDTVDYRLQRQRQQDARFKSRGATWKPSGKPCTLQFVFDEVSKRPPVDSEEHDTAHISHSEPTKARNPTATRVQSPPVLTGKLLHMKQKIQQTEGDKFSNIDASKTRILSKVDKDDSPTESPNLITTTAPFGPPRKAHKSVKAVEPDVIEHPVKKLTNPRIHSKQGLTATVSKQVEAIDFIEQSPSSSSEAEQPPPKPRQKKSTKTLKAKPSTPQSNHSSDDDHIPSDSPPKPSKRIRPKESKAKEAKVGPGRSKGNVNVSKKRPNPNTREDATKEEEEEAEGTGSNQDKQAPNLLSNSTSLQRTAQSSKKRRILLGDNSQQWSVSTSEQTSRKTTIHFGLPLGKTGIQRVQ